MLEAGRYRSAQEIADAEKIGHSNVSRLLRLTLPAPDIQQAILDGRQPKGVQLEELMGAVPGAWEEKRHLCSQRKSRLSNQKPDAEITSRSGCRRCEQGL